MYFQIKLLTSKKIQYTQYDLVWGEKLNIYKMSFSADVQM